MRILIIAPQPFYSERGTPMNIRLLCKVLGEHGYEIDILAFPTGMDIELENTKLIRLPNVFRVKQIPIGPSFIKLAFDGLMVPLATILSLSKKYDVIHGIEEGGFVAVALGLLLKIKSIYDMDSSISDQLKYSGFLSSPFALRCISILEKQIIRKSSLIITVCSALTDKARNYNPDASIFQIEDISTSMVFKDETSAEHVQYIINENNPFATHRVLYTGNLEKYQGIDLLLDAWKQFQSRSDLSPNTVLFMVGGSSKSIAHYKKVSRDKGIDKTICWVGSRPSAEMDSWMNLCDVLVSPRSEGENTPLKIFSYMSSNRPIVATNKHTHTQVLNESMAFLVEPLSEKLSAGIETALRNNALARDKSRRAKELVEKKYSYLKFREKLLNAYATLT